MIFAVLTSRLQCFAVAVGGGAVVLQRLHGPVHTLPLQFLRGSWSCHAMQSDDPHCQAL